MAIKVISATSNRIRRTTASKQSTDSRIKQIVRELGIDYETWKRQSSFRMYSRMASHQTLGIQS